MDTPKRQDKLDSKKKQSSKSIYTSKHTRISTAVTTAVAEKSSKTKFKK